MPRRLVNVRQHIRRLPTGRKTGVVRHTRRVKGGMKMTGDTPNFDRIKKAKRIPTLQDKEFRKWLEEKKNIKSGFLLTLGTKGTIGSFKKEFLKEKRMNNIVAGWFKEGKDRWVGNKIISIDKAKSLGKNKWFVSFKELDGTFRTNTPNTKIFTGKKNATTFAINYMKRHPSL